MKELFDDFWRQLVNQHAYKLVEVGGAALRPPPMPNDINELLPMLDELDNPRPVRGRR